MMATKLLKEALLHKLTGTITKACEVAFGDKFKVREIKSQAVVVKIGDQLIEIKFTFKKDESFNGKYKENFDQVVEGKYK